MHIRKSATPTLNSQVPTEIIDILIGFEDEEKIKQKKRATQRSLEVRRAIEQRNEEQALARNIDEELWFEDI